MRLLRKMRDVLVITASSISAGTMGFFLVMHVSDAFRLGSDVSSKYMAAFIFAIFFLWGLAHSPNILRRLGVIE